MHHRQSIHHARLLCGVAAASLIAAATSAQAETRFDIEPQPLKTALAQFGAQSGYSVLVGSELTGSRNSPGFVGMAADAETALQRVLVGTDLIYCRDRDTYIIVPALPCRQIAQGGEGGSAEGTGAGLVDELIVTAQKREENIQDVPIAISAFSQKSLEEQKIEGGFDLLKAIPNVTFSKNNFSGYNFSIRGVGTKAISATTDPGVAVAFNNTTLIHNRLFEQEYVDVERVEVLRGPQGTLYGRNATSGVINVISAKPDLSGFDGWLKGEVGNFHTKRLSAMVNVPIIEDVLAVRFAGAMTDRQGYDTNTTTGNAINGRDLWSGRLSIGFEPTERIHADFIWERFNEDDNRSRTGKQLCHRDDSPTRVGGATIISGTGVFRLGQLESRQAVFSQGCKPGNLYDDAAFGMPNGLAIPFILAPVYLRGLGLNLGTYASDGPVGLADTLTGIILPYDPYAGLSQSRNLREIDSIRDPIYRAHADLLELNLDFDLTPSLKLVSQATYNKDEVYSSQDYNRFNSNPIFTDTMKLRTGLGAPSPWANMSPGGVFCDPQIGCSNKIVGLDLSKAASEQFSQEFRLQSDFDKPMNFSIGANYTKFDTLIDYYVMFNALTALAETPVLASAGSAFPGGQWVRGYCGATAYHVQLNVFIPTDVSACPYVDPNPLESINGEGHNYFRSKNPYKLESAAAFGELYWNVTEAVKITGGLRYTQDRKSFIPVPSQTLLSTSLYGGGLVSKGSPEKPAIKQKWGEWTGRLGVDWKPELGFTDDTLLYAFYSHGYKGGGANPPTPGFATREEIMAALVAAGQSQAYADAYDSLGALPVLKLNGVEYGETFEPEFVDAFEIGAKNTLLGGALTLNATAFYYDYQDYQISQIRDRTAVNENFNAKTWGVELETVFAPSRNLRITANLGYLDTKVADGETSIDIMNRTQGDPDYVVAKSWVQLPSNCVVPTHVAARWAVSNTSYYNLCGGIRGLLEVFGAAVFDPVLNKTFDIADYPELNGGAGIRAQLGGNELPNAPHWTANIGAQYSFNLLNDWRATVRGDVYWQSQSWARIYNLDPYDKLHGWYNTNLSVWIEKPDSELKIELYVKNLLDDTPITDAFLNSDDSGLTTNVFALDPRLIGLSIRKGF